MRVGSLVEVLEKEEDILMEEQDALDKKLIDTKVECQVLKKKETLLRDLFFKIDSHKRDLQRARLASNVQWCNPKCQTRGGCADISCPARPGSGVSSRSTSPNSDT